MTGLSRTAALLGAILVGALVPQAHIFSWAVRWLVMCMLFLVFLQTRFTREAIHRSHAVLLVANIVIGLVAWLVVGWIGGRDLALAAFFTGITPTATAAPVIVSFLRGRVDYVIAAFMLTNIVVAALLPVLLPFVLGQATPRVFSDVLGSVGLVVFGPMVVGWLVRRIHPRASEWPSKLRTFSFGLWVIALFLITSNASSFLRTQVHAPLRMLLGIATVSLVICAINFATGYLIGGRQLRREASQSLGQKNTTFTIYLALTYASPLVALGPTCYVVWHNLWNSWQLHRVSRPRPSV